MSIVTPLLMMLFGGVGVYGGWRLLAAAAKVRRWPSTAGRVTGRQVVRMPDWPQEPYWRNERGLDCSWEPRVNYTYQVEGKEYAGDRVYHLARLCRRGTAEKVCAELPDQVTVRYNPANPAESCLSFGPSPIVPAIVIVVGGVAALLGAMLLLVRLVDGPAGPAPGL